MCSDTNECVYVCLTSPSHWKFTENTISYRSRRDTIASEPKRDSCLSKLENSYNRQQCERTRRKGIRNNISCVSCLLCCLDAFHALYTSKVDMACLVALNVSLRYTTMSSSFSENNDSVTMSFRSFQSLLNCRRCATTFVVTCE